MAPERYTATDGLLVIDGLTKEFGGLTAVDDLSFAVKENEILGFIGPNGAGKSTTFNCITGVHSPTTGTVWFSGADITGEPDYKLVDRGIARTFQTFEHLPNSTVKKNVQTALIPNELFSVTGISEDVIGNARTICQRVGLGNQMSHLPGELPHSGLIRLELARALATDPDLLLVDEVFAGLSPREVDDIVDILFGLRETGITLVVVDHNMRGMFELIDRAIVISHGAKIAEGDPDAIKTDPDVREAYLGGAI